MLKQLSVGCVILSSLGLASVAQAADLSGTWRTIDDKTGFSKALIEMKLQPNGTYTGTIIKILPRPNYIPKETCQHCPPPYTDKPLVGLTILTDLKQAPNSDTNFINAKVLDPLNGKTYQGKGRLSADGRRLSMRGYVGISALGRNQSWIRED